MTAPRVCVTGTGRSGTGWLAEVLRHAGLNAGHEAYWNPWSSPLSPFFDPGQRQPGLDVDVSWLALADPSFEAYSGAVFHQVRHPLDVISSLAKQPTHEPYRALQLSIMPWDPVDPIEWAMLAWFTYVEAAEKRAEGTWRLEDVDGPLIHDLARSCGHDIDPVLCAQAVDAVPRDTNWHGDGPRYEWVELPKGGLRDAIMDWAKHWGWT